MKTNEQANILSGVRILDLSRVMSGPFCTAMLADLGAEVIKIEMPNIGEEGRHFGPYMEGESTYFMLLNRGKKSVTVNLKSPEGVELIKGLAADSDVLVENFRPGVMQRLGLDYESIKAINRKIVYASISGFGQEGPLANLPAFDLVIQAMSGLMSITGQKDGAPTAVGESLADVCTGMFASWGILGALFNRERTGEGHHLDIAMLDSVYSMLLTGLSRKLYFDETPPRVGNRHPVTYPVDLYPTRTGDIVLVAFSQGIYKNLVAAMGQPFLASDPRFVDNDARNQNERALREIISAWTNSMAREDVLEILQTASVPCAPVWDLDQVSKSEHAKVRQMNLVGQHKNFGEVPLAPQPVHFKGMPRSDALKVPTLGEHTEEVLGKNLGLSPEQLKALAEKQVI